VRRATSAALAAVLALAAGCGGDDEEEVRSAVRGFIEATNERDATRFCEELVTEEFVEQLTGATGDQARDACKTQLRELKATPVELSRFERVRVEGDRARVTATLTALAGEQRRVFRLEKEEGDWRVAGEAGG
jgi:hypothetical protein